MTLNENLLNSAVFVDVNDLVVRLENTSDRDAIVNMCSFFPNRTVKVGMDNSREL